MITKLSIRNFRIFKDFVWSASLLPFSKKNLVYGWNGTGKSTFTEVFKALEKKQNLTGNITLNLGDRSVAGANIANETALPQVKVFNKTYIEENIFNPTGRATSIFYLGQENIEKQKEVEKLNGEVNETRTAISAKTGIKQQQERDLDTVCIEKANTIRTTLRSSTQGNNYNNYNKTHFKNKAESFLSLAAAAITAKKMSDDQYQAQLRQTSATPKDQIANIQEIEIDFVKLKVLVTGLLEETVTSQVLQELETNSNVASWVKQGLQIHKTEVGYSSECSFCKNELKVDRVQALEGHFNDAYNNFIGKIDRNLAVLDQRINSFQAFRFPDKNAIYDTHVSNYVAAVAAYEAIIATTTTILVGVKAELVEKKKIPFQKVSLQTSIPDALNVSVASINEIISQNNADTISFNQSVALARTAIEEHIVASALSDFNLKKDAVVATTSELANLSTKLNELTTKITDLERSVREDLKPAEELNNDIKSYLGRNELKFTVRDNGYELTRGSAVAENLSEGEKTAIAFLHFLKSLSGKNFNLESGIVVIDDPISSLDSNSIYHAFGFMKEKTDKAGQLFILTHNHTFFRQVKNWFNHLPKQKGKKVENHLGRFYMIQSSIIEKERQSVLTRLDSLLHEYESEYHYLFSIVQRAASTQAGELKEAYPLPNVSRRLIETFLAFKYPSSKNLYSKIEEVQFDTSKKNRILRFIDTYSHFVQISDPEHDPSILQESQAIMIDVLDFIKTVDENHFNSMVALVVATEE